MLTAITVRFFVNAPSMTSLNASPTNATGSVPTIM